MTDISTYELNKQTVEDALMRALTEPVDMEDPFYIPGNGCTYWVRRRVSDEVPASTEMV